MKRMRVMALSMMVIGLAGCASTQDRYYVPGDGRGGDYYYAPEPYDDGYRPYYYGGFGGYCPWGPFDCGWSYNSGYNFSFGFSYGYDPWWGYAPYYHGPSHVRRDQYRPQAETMSWSEPSQAMPSSREDRSQDTRTPLRNERSLRVEPADPAPAPRNRGRRPPTAA
jgi:hypothetical protein